MKKIFNKLNYENWEANEIESFYLIPLRKNLLKLRSHLFRLFMNGLDYYRIPLSSNTVFLKDVKTLIESELIAENLMGFFII